MSERVGIITHYYNSQNYGGNLQAYALVKVIENIGDYQVEQICYDTTPIAEKSKITLKKLIRLPKRVLSSIANKKAQKQIAVKDGEYANCFKQRAQAFNAFNKNKINHGTTVYNKTNVDNANGEYDYYITGSDQVWNPKAVHPAYLLDFVKGKPKFSYAASIACDQLTDKEKQMFKTSLKDYSGISVRENKAIELLQPLTEKKVRCDLDPTLLLTKEDWDKVIEQGEPSEKYMFCYFLGDDMRLRALATEYAKKHDLKIVTLPFMQGHYRDCDKDFGDQKLFDVDPLKFVWLIKHASVVFTDSFHAMVFSNVYKKDYIIFARGKGDLMNSRIYQLIELFGGAEKFVNEQDKYTINYIENNLKWLDSQGASIDEKRTASIEYLKDLLSRREKE